MVFGSYTRREFFRGGVLVAAFVAASVAGGCALVPYVCETDVLRPPGAQDEARLMARCIRCYRCISVCPRKVLIPLRLEAGIFSVRTPVLDYSDSFCDFCGLCSKVCPTSAIGVLDPFTPWLGRIGVAVVRKERCLAWLDSGCGICVDECPYEALSFDGSRRPIVDTARCNGCGICVEVCPANVSRSFSGDSVRGIEVVTEKRFAGESPMA
jgi:ferredoxin-type protein NapG